MSKHKRLSVAVLMVLIAAVTGGRAAQAATWQKTAEGKYNWLDAANWDQIPSAPGSIADFRVDLAGDQTVQLDQSVTLGTLTMGDTQGNSKLTLASGKDGTTLLFEGDKPGAPTAINVNAPTLASEGSDFSINAGIKLGGTSPLTLNLNGTTGASTSVVLHSIDLNGNILTVNGTPNPTPLDGSKTTLNPGKLSGNGTYVQNGGTVHLGSSLDRYTGTITVNGGLLNIAFANSVSTVSQITLAGVFQHVDKYPMGGRMILGSAGAVPFSDAMPDRFNHNGILTFNGGGFLAYNGAVLTGAKEGKAVVEQVRQIQFNVGLCEIRMLNGNGSSPSTTLLANDPAKSFTRQQGATLMIGGDDSASGGGRFWRAMGVKEKLVFASGMKSELKGGGGLPDSTNQSIIPWMVVGTIYHPGQGGFLTYDHENGVHAMHPEEYYRGGHVSGASETENVFESDLNLGANKTKTINSYRTSAWGNTDIGRGSTLVVTSGAVQFNGTISAGGGSIGCGNPADAGTIDFGKAEGIIWAGFNSQVHGDGTPGDAMIGSRITGSGGLTKSGSNNLRLLGANAYTGKTIVSSGMLRLGNGKTTASKLGKGEVEVTPGSTLKIAANVADGIADDAKVTLDNNGVLYYGLMDLAAGINEKIGGLVLGGVAQRKGTYGSSQSNATFKLDDYFSGTGIVTVTQEPRTSNAAGVVPGSAGERRH